MKRLLTIFLLLLLPAAAAGTPPAPPPFPPDGLLGESLAYDISFLWFDRLAEGHLSFSAGERPGTYRAELEARTLGVAGWLTGDRAQRYVSIMKMGPDGQLQPLSHESIILKGKGKDQRRKSKLYTFDYAKGEVLYQRLKEGKVTREEIIPLDRQVAPKDVLTAFVNFRAGLVGPLRPGAHYVIPTFSHKGDSDIIVDTVPAEARENYPSFPRRGLLARVTLDPEIFDTGGGYIYVWFDEAGRPARAAVENVIGMGDVRGTLRH